MARRWLNAFQQADGQAQANLFAKSEHVRYLGSGKNEYWSGTVLRDGYADHVAELPALTLDCKEIEAFEHVNTGWALCITEVRLHSSGRTWEERFSLVFVLEDSAWRIIQAHLSSPRANLDTIGIEHKALDKLLALAAERFDISQIEGIATVMFTDIVDSTKLAQVLGDRFWADAVSRHIDRVNDLVRESGGRMIKSLGDGTMSVFGSTSRAIRAAMEIRSAIQDCGQEPALGIRVGMHTGEVIQTDGDFFGTVVNKAARITGMAAANQILMSGVTRTMVEFSDRHGFGELIEVDLKGFEGGQTICELLGDNT